MKKTYDSKFKSRVALKVILRNRTIAEIAGEYNILPNLVAQWKKKLLESLPDVFATQKEKKEDSRYPEEELLRQIGQLKVENEFLQKKYAYYLWKTGKNS